MGLMVTTAVIAEPPIPTWRDAIDLVPADTDVLLVLSDAASLRVSGAGPTLQSMLASAMPLTAASDAWSALANGVGLSEPDAFDALLGRWSVFVARHDPENATLRWCVASVVTPAVAVRLLGALGAKPAEIKAGRPVAQIENGRFTVASVLDRRRAVLLLAPRGSGDLFANLLARLVGGDIGGTLTDDPTVARVGAALPGSANLYLFFPSEKPPGNDDFDPATVWTGLAASAHGLTISMNLAVAPLSVDNPGSPIDPRAWEQASRGAALAVLEPTTADSLALGGLLGALEIDPTDLLAPIHGAIGLFLTEPAPGRAALGFAVQTTSTALLASIGDRVLASVAARISDRRADDFRTLDGAFPASIRRLQAPLAKDARRWLSWMDPDAERLPLVWSYPVVVDAKAGGAGWWFVTTDKDLHARLSGALAGPPAAHADPEPSPDLYLVARPVAVLGILRRIGVVGEDTPPILTSLGLIESIAGVGRYSDGVFRGSATLRLLPPDGRR